MIVGARNLRDMLEIVAYDIVTDTYEVRYQWVIDGKRETFLAEPIGGGQDLNEAVDLRLAECLKHRGIE